MLQVMLFSCPDTVKESFLQHYAITGISSDYPGDQDEFIGAKTDLIKALLIKRKKSGWSNGGELATPTRSKCCKSTDSDG